MIFATYGNKTQEYVFLHKPIDGVPLVIPACELDKLQTEPYCFGLYYHNYVVLIVYLDFNRNTLEQEGTSKVGAISKAQRAQKTFLKKNMKILNFFQKMSHSAEKCERADPLGFINIYSVAKYQKTRKGDSFETLKNFRKKVAQCQKKSKGGPFSLVRFCRLR